MVHVLADLQATAGGRTGFAVRRRPDRDVSRAATLLTTSSRRSMTTPSGRVFGGEADGAVDGTRGLEPAASRRSRSLRRVSRAIRGRRGAEQATGAVPPATAEVVVDLRPSRRRGEAST